MPNNIPNFLIIGAAKAATTTLAGMLSQHPQAGIVTGKEPHYFSMDQQYSKGWMWYQNGFIHCRNKVAVGDASTSYSRIRYYPETVKRIITHLPDVKIIYMVRHPLERIESAYIQRLSYIDAVHAYPTVNHAVRAEPMLIDSSRYWEVFSHYRRFIDEERIKIVWFEEFTSDITLGFREVCRFLDIDETIVMHADEKFQNSREQVLGCIRETRQGKLPEIGMEWEPDTRKWVLDQLRHDNSQFLAYFGKPQDYWGKL